MSQLRPEPPFQGRIGDTYHDSQAWWPDPAAAPQHFLNFFPLPQGHGSLRPTLGSARRTGSGRGPWS